MLRDCLIKAYTRLDAAAVDVYVTRVFGAGWKEREHTATSSLSSVIRAIRRGSLVLRALPTSAAGAIKSINAVGRFKGRLITALKHGMQDTPPRRVGRRRSTQDSSVAVGWYGATSQVDRASRRSTQSPAPGVDSGDGSSAAVTSASDTAAKALTGTGSQQRLQPSTSTQMLGTPANESSNGVAGSQQVMPEQSSTDVVAGEQPGAATTATTDSSSRGKSEDGSTSARHLLSQRSSKQFITPRSATDSQTGGFQPTAAPGVTDKAAVCLATMPSVSMLSAMEAVRQAWLREETSRATGSGGGEGYSQGGSRRSTRSSGGGATSRFSGGGAPSDVAAIGGVASSRSTAGNLPLLGDMVSRAGDTLRAAATFAVDDKGESQSPADGLEHAAEIAAEQGAAEASIRATSTSRPKPSLQVSLLSVQDPENHMSASGPAVAASASGTTPKSTRPRPILRVSLSRQMRDMTPLSPSASGQQGPSTSRTPTSPGGAMFAAAAGVSASLVPGTWVVPPVPVTPKRVQLAPPPPPAAAAASLATPILTDADDVAAPRHDEDETVDADEYKPGAPEEAGKRNALMMRQLHKKKSLKRLEDKMLEVAMQG